MAPRDRGGRTWKSIAISEFQELHQNLTVAHTEIDLMIRMGKVNLINTRAHLADALEIVDVVRAQYGGHLPHHRPLVPPPRRGQ